MPYVRKTSARKYPKKRFARKTTSATTKHITAVAKKVLLRVAETKMRSGLINTESLYHNVWHKMMDNMLITNHGLGDDARIGDNITAKYVKIWIVIKQPIDRPNVNFRFCVLRTRDYQNMGTFPSDGTTTINTVDQVDNEAPNGKVVFQKWFADRSMSYSRHDNTGTHNNELLFVKQYTIPLKNVKYGYNSDNGQWGNNYNLTPYICAYDTFGTLTTDVIASMRVVTKFYFADI